MCLRFFGLRKSSSSTQVAAQDVTPQETQTQPTPPSSQVLAPTRRPTIVRTFSADDLSSEPEPQIQFQALFSDEKLANPDKCSRLCSLLDQHPECSEQVLEPAHLATFLHKTGYAPLMMKVLADPQLKIEEKMQTSIWKCLLPAFPKKTDKPLISTLIKNIIKKQQYKQELIAFTEYCMNLASSGSRVLTLIRVFNGSLKNTPRYAIYEAFRLRAHLRLLELKNHNKIGEKMSDHDVSKLLNKGGGLLGTEEKRAFENMIKHPNASDKIYEAEKERINKLIQECLAKLDKITTPAIENTAPSRTQTQSLGFR